MPLELGMAMAYGLLGRSGERHEWLVLVPNGHGYSRFISDLSGFDPARHDGSPRGVIAKVVAWLWTLERSTGKPTPQQVTDALPGFEMALERLRFDWTPAEPPWSEIVLTAIANKPV